MSKTYKQLVEETINSLKDNNYLDMAIPHPDGSVYHLVEKMVGGESYFSVFKVDKVNGEWQIKPISKDCYDKSAVENAMGDLSNQFKDLLPKD
jgi:hypothetical protein